MADVGLRPDEHTRLHAEAHALMGVRSDVPTETFTRDSPIAAIDMLAMASFPAVTVPQATNLIVEIRSEGYTDSRFFYLGATQGAETIPGYLRAPTCAIANPVMTHAAGYSQTHLIMAVSGAY